MINRTSQRPKVFGTGLIALDIVMSADVEVQPQAWAGGTCGNVLAILSYLGWESFPIARMNGDPASERVRADLARWGVRMDYAACEPTSHTPIIIQEIRRKRDGSPTHRFSWACPKCGKWLPGFKAVTRKAIDAVGDKLDGSNVFFMDRLSSAALSLARSARESGALVMFEPSGRSNPKHFEQAFEIAHIVKYSDERLAAIDDCGLERVADCLEIQTLGKNGLRFRLHRNGRLGDWEELPAFPAPQFVDSCGAGDWCSAGLLSVLGTKGADGFLATDMGDIRSALGFGQALSAWNCAFEGARGGMYAISPDELKEMVAEILNGGLERPVPLSGRSAHGSVECPACAA